MSNEVIWNDLSSERLNRRQARLTLGTVVAVLALLMTQVPGPTAVFRFVSAGFEPATAAAGSAGAQIETALLVIAGLVVWMMAAWTALMSAATLISALAPQSAARTANRVLARCTPRVVRQMLLTAVGVGALAGLTACAPAAGTVGNSPAAGQAGTTFTSDLPTSDIGDVSSWDLDWPIPSDTSQIELDSPSMEPPPVDEPSNPHAATVQSSESVEPGSDSESAPTTDSADNGASGIPNEPSSPQSPDIQGSTTDTPGYEETAGHAPLEPNGTAPTSPSAEIDSAGVDPGDIDPPPGNTAATDPAAIDPAAIDPAPMDPAATDPAAIDLDWPTTSADPSTVDVTPVTPAPMQPLPETAAATVTVQPGDTLWAIAKAHLPADSSVAEIDTAWRAWYLANQSTIGTNPDQILVGLDLTPPA